jgi:hypothetical protein
LGAAAKAAEAQRQATDKRMNNLNMTFNGRTLHELYAEKNIRSRFRQRRQPGSAKTCEESGGSNLPRRGTACTASHGLDIFFNAGRDCC